MTGDLRLELTAVGEERERVMGGLGEHLHAARGHEPLEAAQGLGRPALHLLDGGARDGEGTPEGPPVALHEAQQEVPHRDVAPLRDAAQDALVLRVVEVGRPLADVEEREPAQPPGLVDVEVEDDVGHDRTAS